MFKGGWIEKRVGFLEDEKQNSSSYSQTLQLGCKAEVADRGWGRKCATTSKAERAFAVCSSGRWNKRRRDFCFCKYANSVYYKNTKSQKRFSWFHSTAPLLLNRLLLGLFSPQTRQVSTSTQLTQPQRPREDACIQRYAQTNSPNLLFKTPILLQASSAVRQLPCCRRGTPGKKSAERRTCHWRQSSCQTALTATPGYQCTPVSAGRAALNAAG